MNFVRVFGIETIDVYQEKKQVTSIAEIPGMKMK